MSSFFTLPTSQKKRKRSEAVEASSTKRRNASTKLTERPQKSAPRKPRRDDSISGSDSELEETTESIPSATPSTSGSDDEDEDETGAERRRKLAERYLANVESEVCQEVGFDAEDVDRDLIAERLREDVAETKGRMYRNIAGDYDYGAATKAAFRQGTDCISSISICAPYAYTVSRDLCLTKWELPEPSKYAPKNLSKNPIMPRRRPKKLKSTKGDRHKSSDHKYQHHTAPILCCAASSDGKFVATGGEDKKLIIWSATDLTPLRVFTQHRDSVNSIVFRRGTNQLYSASSDRTIKIWSLDELAYVETLFGHQDRVVGCAALSQERCLSAGARDRTVRLWKVVEESQLVFNGGSKRKKGNDDFLAEGSIDTVAFIDDDTFISGSDNGSLNLWSLQRKKPLFELPLAHGRDPPLKLEDVYAEQHLEGRKVPGPPAARWITALHVIPYSDLVVTGSWDGEVRIWRVTADRKKIEPAGIVGRVDHRDLVPNGENGDEEDSTTLEPESPPPAEGSPDRPIRGVINDIDVFVRERGAKSSIVAAGLCIVVGVGKHHRFARWQKLEGSMNGAVVFEVPEWRGNKPARLLEEKGDH